VDAYAEIGRTACGSHGASQDPVELAEALRVIDTLAPQVIVEIGCDTGGTLWAWRQVCERVYGVTLADNSTEAGGSGQPLVDHGATVHVGDSHDMDSWEWLNKQLGGDLVDVLVIDGDHKAVGVLSDWEMYSPLVRPGGVVLFHDINVTNDPRAEVHTVWPEFCGDYETQVIGGGPFGWGVVRIPDAEGGAA
jgi:cephalosporin hydroxylase